MKTEYIVKLFEQSPFDKSDYIKDVQILCELNSGKPFAHLDSPYDWVGQELSIGDLEVEWQNKKSKHLVIGDTVVFGKGYSYYGVIENIISDNEIDSYWNDTFHLINCKDELSENAIESVRNMSDKIEPIQKVKRSNVECKRWLCAKIKNDNIIWKKIEKEWNHFFEENKPSKHAILDWWKLKTNPKEY